MFEKMPENLIENMFRELRNTNLPIYIWGGAKLARKVKEYLEVNAIKIDGFLINQKYWNNNKTSFEGYPLRIFEDYLSENRCNLVVAFDGYSEEQITEYKDNIYGLYVIDFIGILCLEGGCSLISSEFYLDNKKGFEWLENHLYDEKSKNALREYLFQKMSGVYTKDDYEMNQYFPDDIIHLQEQEVFLNCGAYHGEVALDFLKQLQDKGVGEYKKIICVEADKNNCSVLKTALETYKNVEVISAGVWDRDDIMYINVGYGETSRISVDGTEKIRVKAIDHILKGSEATYIKMDIEGSELKALHGAVETIKKYKPKLAICVYHKQEDLIEIPRYIHSIRDDYRFYLRNHNPHGTETVLYAV